MGGLEEIQECGRCLNYLNFLAQPEESKNLDIMKRPAARKSLLSVNSMMKPLAFFLTGADGGELVRNQVA